MIITERGWHCLNLGCPTREPVRAAEPPRCYTCERPMAEVHYPVTEKEIARLAAEIEASASLEFEPSQRLITELEEYRSPPEDSPARSGWGESVIAHAWLKPLNFPMQGCAADATSRGERAHKELERYLRERPPSNPFPYGYDVVAEETGRATYSAEQHPIRVQSVAPDDRGQLSVRIARRELERIAGGTADPISVGYDIQTRYQPAYRCTRAGCPTREPVRASSPPTCYTCSQPMAMVDEFTRPELVSGIGELIEDIQRRITATCDIPPSILFGDSPAGLGATGEAAAQAWYNRIGWSAEALRERVRRGDRDWFMPADVEVPYFDRKGPPQIARDDHRFCRPGERYKPIGVSVTLDGEPITVRGGFYVPDGGVRLLVPRGDETFWRCLERDAYHTIEWHGFRAEFQAIESVRRTPGGTLEVRFRRLRPNLRAEELYPALAPDIAIMRDETAAPEARLAAASRLLETLPGEPKGALGELRDEIRAALTGLPTWWCACERAVIQAGAAEVTLLLDQNRGLIVQVTPTVHDHTHMSEGAIANFYSRAARSALPEGVKVSVEIMRQPLIDDDLQKNSQ